MQINSILLTYSLMSYAAFWSNGKNKNAFTNKYKKIHRIDWHAT